MAVSANRLGTFADRRRGRPRKIDRPLHRARLHGGRDAEGGRSRYGQETEVRADINPKTGEIRFSRLLLVVEQIENDATQIALADAQKKNPSAQIGDWIAESLPPFDFGRIPAQSSKQVLVQKIREAERDKQYDVYKDRIGEIINGVVKRVEYGNVVVDLGGSGAGEAVVRRDEMIPREMFRPGDRIRAYVYDVRREQRGPQIFLSRTHPQFTAKLFGRKCRRFTTASSRSNRSPATRARAAKIAVISNDSSIDPVGACVGMRGSRVQAVVNELQGEKIDIIPWSADAATFIVNALQPAEVMKVVLDEDSTRIEVVVPDDQLSLAIGRAGRNVRLASQLTGWDIDILTEAEESERRQKEFVERTNVFMGALDVDETVRAIAGLRRVPLGRGTGFLSNRPSWRRSRGSTPTPPPRFRRARRAIWRVSRPNSTNGARRWGSRRSQVDRGRHHADAGQIRRNDVKSVEDLAGCATDDLVGWTDPGVGEDKVHAGFLDGFDISREQADAMIMSARVRAGWVEASPEPVEEAEPEEAGQAE